MTCIAEWVLPQRTLTGSHVHGLKFWRTLDIYVDPNSVEILELGTKDYPYKNLILPFIEILNFHSHSDSEIKIYIPERANLEITLSTIAIINIKSVSIITYSLFNSTPVAVTVSIKKSGVALWNMKTAFNILSDSTSDLSLMLNNSALTAKEKSQAVTDNVSFMVIRSSFLIDGVSFITDFSTNLTSHIFFKPIYLQNRTLTLKNANLQGLGKILESFDPMNFVGENIEIDHYRMAKGFTFKVDCNYPEASLLNLVSFKNITVYNSQQKTVAIEDSFISFYNAANLTISDSNIALYASSTENEPVVDISSIDSCNPDDGVKQIVNIDNTTLVLLQNDIKTRYTNVHIIIIETNARSVDFNFSKLSFKNITNSIEPLVDIIGSSKTSLVLSNSNIQDASLLGSVYSIYSVGSISFQTVSLTNITDFGKALIEISSGTTVALSGVTISSCSSKSESKLHYIYIQTKQAIADVSLANLNFMLTNVKNRKSIRVVTSSQFSLTNSQFSDVDVGAENSLISLDSLTQLNMNGVNFTKINSIISGDNTNKMLEFMNLNASMSTDLLINNVIVSNSKISFIYLDRVVGTLGKTKTFTISNFQYKDSVFLDKNDLLTFTKMDLSDNFTISINGLTFSNITFPYSGNILLIQQQLMNTMTITNMSAKNIKNGYVHIETLNPQNTLLPTRVAFTTLTTDYINSGFNSFINVYAGAIVNITSSTIKNWFSFEEGSFLKAGDQKAVVNIVSSAFSNNAAAQGGVFFVEKNSIIKLFSSNVSSNFALVSGVIKTQNNGAFEFYNSRVFSNIAVALSVCEIFDVALTPIISNTQIYSNVGVSRNNLKTYITSATSWGTLCWLKSEFKAYLLANPVLLTQIESTFAMQVISSSLMIGEGSQIYSQPKLLTSFVSTVTMLNSIYRDTIFQGVAIQVTGSTMNITNLTISGAQTSTHYYTSIIQTSLNSVLLVNTIKFTSSSVPLFTLLSADGDIQNINVSGVTWYGFIFKTYKATNATFNNWSVVNSNAWGLFVLEVYNSYIHSITNMNFTNIYYTTGYISRSRVRLIDNVRSEMNAAMVWYAIDSNIELATNLYMYNNGKNYQNWGTFNNYNSNVTITDTLFDFNRGKLGGGIRIIWTKGDSCSTTLTNVTFKNNFATQLGGAIYYDIYRPVMTNVVFLNNTDSKGANDVHSYPVRVVKAGTTSKNISINNIPSGQVSPVVLEFSVVDADDNLSKDVDGTSITIFPIEPNTTVLGGTSEEIVLGVAHFRGIIFQAKPGSKNVKFGIRSNAINKSKILKQYGVESIQEPLYVSFRFCEPGEVDTDNKWQFCRDGTYSLGNLISIYFLVFATFIFRVQRNKLYNMYE